MTPLSECIAGYQAFSTVSAQTLDAWSSAATGLEADLADANARAMELTARCDRMRVERDVARAVMRNEPDVQERWEAMLYAEFCAQEDAAKARAGIVILHLVYEMREHAREQKARRIFDQCENMRSVGLRQGRAVSGLQASRLHRRAQAAESRAIKAEREAATLRVRLQGAIAKIPPGDLWRTPDPVVDARPTPTLPEFMRRSLAAMATIPPVALEATSGGARGLDAAEASVPKCVLCRKPNPDWFACSTCRSASDYEGDCANPTEGAPTLAEIKARQADEDLVRRRVTERAEEDVDPEEVAAVMFDDEDDDATVALSVFRRSMLGSPEALNATIAERDARIASLERERDGACAEIEETWEVLGTLRRGRGLRLPGRAEMLRQSRDTWNEQAQAERTRAIAAETARDEAIASAERAEATIARAVRRCRSISDSASLAYDLVAILGGKEGA